MIYTSKILNVENECQNDFKRPQQNENQQYFICVDPKEIRYRPLEMFQLSYIFSKKCLNYKIVHQL